MNDSPQRRLVIVGGGSAGWMAAVFLSKVLSLETSSHYSITVVESEEVPSIGVGEATLISLRQFLSAAGVQEGEFLVAADATFKHGILFRDWFEGSSSEAERDQYFHPFEAYPPIAPELMVNHWLNARHQGACTDRYDKWSGIQGVLAAAGLSPKSWHANAYEGEVPYGYHLDATKFANFLKSLALQRGVTHVQGHVADVALDENGRIQFLTLRDNQRIDGDFFIDCTGFASVLIGKLSAEFVPLGERLLVDAAVSARVPSLGAPRPYTTATAREAGWTFELDLSSRRGFGYVYSSGHLDADKAEQQLRTFLGADGAGASVTHTRMRVGRLKDAWIKNCVAVGLSAGFLEPLESTGLYFIEIALRLLVDFLDLDEANEQVRHAYNKAVAQIFDNIAQFITLHYVLTNRNDTEFWRNTRATLARDPELEDMLRLWSFKAPTDSDFFGPTTPFGAANYAAILFGMRRLTTVIPGSVRHVSAEQSMAHYKTLKNIQANAVKSLPSHEQYLKKFTGAFSESAA